MDTNPTTDDATNLTPNDFTTNPVYQYNDEDPSWSPDGKQITYSTVHDVWKMPSDDGDPKTNLTDGTGGGIHPAWSPDGNRIVYASGFDIYVMNTNGGNKTPVDTTSRKDEKPDWQPIPQCTITGTSGDDTGKNAINGTTGDDVICGLGGNDTIKGLGGNDTLYGGPGGNTLYGGPGKDTVVGGANTPTDALRGDAGNDVIKAHPDSSATSGGGVDPNGNDMSSGAGNDKIFGSDGSETIELLSDFPRSGTDCIYSHGGNDRINTRDGEVDRVDCRAGEDDRVTAEHIDIVLGGCETVFLPPPS